MDSSPSPYSNYSNNSKNVCMCTTVAIVLVLMFIVSPLNNFFIASFLGKLTAILILAFALYKNVTNTNELSQSMNTALLTGDWTKIKTNIVCSYIFSFLILLLFFSVIKKTIFV